MGGFVGGGGATVRGVGSVAGVGQAASSATPWGAIAMGADTALNFGKAIFGGIQAIKGRKQMKNLLANRPQYEISQGYKDAFKTYQQLASSQLPGYDIMKGQIEQSGAKTNQALERGAMGSNQYMSGILGSQDKELDALRQLGLASAQWRGQQQQNLAGAQNQYGQLQDVQFQTNQLDPWNIKANMANENRQAGAQNLFGGLGDMSGALSNFAGTSAYLKALQALQPQGGTGNGMTQQTIGNGVTQQMSAPLSPPNINKGTPLNYWGTLNKNTYRTGND